MEILLLRAKIIFYKFHGSAQPVNRICYMLDACPKPKLLTQAGLGFDATFVFSHWSSSSNVMTSKKWSLLVAKTRTCRSQSFWSYRLLCCQILPPTQFSQVEHWKRIVIMNSRCLSRSGEEILETNQPCRLPSLTKSFYLVWKPHFFGFSCFWHQSRGKPKCFSWCINSQSTFFVIIATWYRLRVYTSCCPRLFDLHLRQYTSIFSQAAWTLLDWMKDLSQHFSISSLAVSVIPRRTMMKKNSLYRSWSLPATPERRNSTLAAKLLLQHLLSACRSQICWINLVGLLRVLSATHATDTSFIHRQISL